MRHANRRVAWATLFVALVSTSLLLGQQPSTPLDPSARTTADDHQNMMAQLS